MNIEIIKEQLKLSDVLKYYNVECTNQSSGSWWCPIHEKGGKETGHKTPSLLAKDEVGNATCLSQQCLSGDDIFGVIQKVENISFKESIEVAKKISGIQTDIKTNSKPIEPLKKEHKDYLIKEGIDPNFAIEKFSLKSRYNYILYPQIQNKVFCGYKGISIEKDKETQKRKMFFEGDSKGCKIFLESMVTKSTDTLIIVEGEKDCIRMNQELSQSSLNTSVAISFSNGAISIPSYLESFILDNDIKSISIFYDNDEAGKKGSIKLQERLLPLNLDLKIYKFSSNEKNGYDISDWFNDKNSIEDLFQLNFEKTNEIKLDFNDIFSQQILTTEFIENSIIPEKILKTGFKEIDEEAPIVMGQNTIITARTGKGKTAFAVNMINGILKNNEDVKVIFFSLELTKKDLFHRLIATYSNLNKRYIERGFIDNSGVLHNSQKDKYFSKAISYQKKYQSRFLIYDDLFTVEEIEDEIKKLQKHSFKPDYIIIDYANIMYFKKHTEEKYIEISKWIKRFAKKEKIHIQAICQANRMTSEKADGFARTENLADSDQFGRDAFTVYSVKSDADLETMSINPTKNRNGRIEQVYEFQWNPKSGKIFDDNYPLTESKDGTF